MIRPRFATKRRTEPRHEHLGVHDVQNTCRSVTGPRRECCRKHQRTSSAN